MTGLVYRSILPDVKIRRLIDTIKAGRPEYSEENVQVNQREYVVFAEGVGSFYARDGNEVEFSVLEGADEGWVNLYLNGQVTVALLHQRKHHHISCQQLYS